MGISLGICLAKLTQGGFFVTTSAIKPPSPHRFPRSRWEIRLSILFLFALNAIVFFY